MKKLFFLLLLTLTVVSKTFSQQPVWVQETRYVNKVGYYNVNGTTYYGPYTSVETVWAQRVFSTPSVTEYYPQNNQWGYGNSWYYQPRQTVLGALLREVFSPYSNNQYWSQPFYNNWYNQTRTRRY